MYVFTGTNIYAYIYKCMQLHSASLIQTIFHNCLKFVIDLNNNNLTVGCNFRCAVLITYCSREVKSLYVKSTALEYLQDKYLLNKC